MKWSGETKRDREARLRAGVSAFAWWPTQMASGEWIWGEDYWVALHQKANNQTHWVRALKRKDCIQQYPTRPPAPTKEVT
jgi:hypothetical protein